MMLVLLSLGGYAQQSDKKGLFMMPGITNNPFLLSYGYSAATTYALQIGTYQHVIKGVVRFGVPSYSPEIASPHQVDYTIKGAYVQPGILLYTDDFATKKNVLYVGLLGYFGHYNHDLKLTINDPYWGTSEFNYSGKSDIYGVMFEFGGLFTLYKELKGSCSLDFAGAWYPKNPIPEIQNFRDKTRIIPGLGSGTTGLLGLNFGLHYVID